jgi:hypothetical protein
MFLFDKNDGKDLQLNKETWACGALIIMMILNWLANMRDNDGAQYLNKYIAAALFHGLCCLKVHLNIIMA